VTKKNPFSGAAIPFVSQLRVVIKSGVKGLNFTNVKLLFE
jgi:hypothetical protein